MGDRRARGLKEGTRQPLGEAIGSLGNGHQRGNAIVAMDLGEARGGGDVGRGQHGGDGAELGIGRARLWWMTLSCRRVRSISLSFTQVLIFWGPAWVCFLRFVSSIAGYYGGARVFGGDGG
jgi:hypothetical protein